MADATIQIKRDTRANWASNNPTLSLGQFGYDTTNHRLYIGTGAASFTTLETAMDYVNIFDSDQQIFRNTSTQLELEYDA